METVRWVEIHVTEHEAGPPEEIQIRNYAAVTVYDVCTGDTGATFDEVKSAIEGAGLTLVRQDEHHGTD